MTWVDFLFVMRNGVASRGAHAGKRTPQVVNQSAIVGGGNRSSSQLNQGNQEEATSTTTPSKKRVRPEDWDFLLICTLLPFVLGYDLPNDTPSLVWISRMGVAGRSYPFPVI